MNEEQLDIEDIHRRLSQLVFPEILETWWDEPNGGFNGDVPRDLLETPKGRDRLRLMLFQLESGMPG